MLQNLQKGFNVYVNAELVFDERLVRIVPCWVVNLIVCILSGNNFLDNMPRLTFPLNEGQDMVDIVRHDIVLIIKRKPLLWNLNLFFICFSKPLLLISCLYSHFSYNRLLAVLSRLYNGREWMILCEKIVFWESILKWAVMKSWHYTRRGNKWIVGHCNVEVVLNHTILTIDAERTILDFKLIL